MDGISYDGIERTASLLGLIPGDSSNNRVLRADDAVESALSVALSLSGFGLSLAGGVLFLAGCLPRLCTGDVPDLEERRRTIVRTKTRGTKSTMKWM